MELLSLIIKGSIFVCEKRFIEGDNTSSKVVTMKEEVDAVKVYRIGNLVNIPRLMFID